MGRFEKKLAGISDIATTHLKEKGASIGVTMANKELFDRIQSAMALRGEKMNKNKLLHDMMELYISNKDIDIY